MAGQQRLSTVKMWNTAVLNIEDSVKYYLIKLWQQLTLGFLSLLETEDLVFVLKGAMSQFFKFIISYPYGYPFHPYSFMVYYYLFGDFPSSTTTAYFPGCLQYKFYFVQLAKQLSFFKLIP